MFKINFDLFYELNHGSVISITHSNDRLGIDSTSFYRVKNSTLEIKYVDHTHEKTYDWHKSDCIAFHPNSVIKIVERFRLD